jgi:hypothetical protein
MRTFDDAEIQFLSTTVPIKEGIDVLHDILVRTRTHASNNTGMVRLGWLTAGLAAITRYRFDNERTAQGDRRTS